LDICLHIVGHQISAGNIPAREFGRLLRLLDNNLQALQSALQNTAGLAGVEFDFSNPEVPLPTVPDFNPNS
jgi:hypothetical protein